MLGTETIRIEFTLTPREIVLANETVMREQLGVGYSRTTRMMFVFIAMPVILYQVYTRMDPRYGVYIVLLVAALTYVIFYLARRADESRQRPEHMIIDISQKGLTATRHSTVNHFEWASIARILEADDLIILVMAGIDASVAIPQRAFTDQEQLDQFHAHLALIRRPE